MNDIYAKLRNYFSEIEDVVVNEGRGAQGIKYNGRCSQCFIKGI